MIYIIDGEKGSGKTKKIIDKANSILSESKGDTVFLSTTIRYRAEVKPQIKFINTISEGITSKDLLFGFLKGMHAANYDIEHIFIDGVYKMMKVEIDSNEMSELFMLLENLSANAGINFTLTISCDRSKLPAFIAKYL